MGIFSSDGEAKVYDWAMRHGVPNPAGFAIEHADVADDEEYLRREARADKRLALQARLGSLREQKAEAEQRIAYVEGQLADLDAEEGNDGN